MTGSDCKHIFHKDCYDDCEKPAPKEKPEEDDEERMCIEVEATWCPYCDASMPDWCRPVPETVKEEDEEATME